MKINHSYLSTQDSVPIRKKVQGLNSIWGIFFSELRNNKYWIIHGGRRKEMHQNSPTNPLYEKVKALFWSSRITTKIFISSNSLTGTPLLSNSCIPRHTFQKAALLPDKMKYPTAIPLLSFSGFRSSMYRWSWFKIEDMQYVEVSTYFAATVHFFIWNKMLLSLESFITFNMHFLILEMEERWNIKKALQISKDDSPKAATETPFARLETILNSK